ncbi:transporter substrate-binding domain-containing protein [Terasakiella sp. A23]|uniref:substrate-binding periplasmic protein n=1 Tax=Terasakiella sp. FCG-A23 TaxID=3080561 RepID=UPI002954406D|nr:transporter substrate-binding domain-containing protein [Terasakiella sp. A23]MDV7341377.1 transporter substrate-binding domain-containing protein [Terasakiella sp. A23]
MNRKPWKTHLSVFLRAFSFLCLWPFTIQATETVKVGVTHFPPFYIVSDDNQVSGLGIDLIEALNQIQDDYRFTPIIASPRRRHQMFQDERFDMSFFDHLAWGWDKDQVDATDVYLTGGEVFITQKAPGRDKSFFSNIQNRSIAAIRGYHYKFADYVTDPHALKTKFNITLTNSQDHILKLVAENRVEIGIMTETYLLQYFQKNPAAKGQFLTAEQYDQVYNFRTILRKNTKPSANEMNKLMTALRKNANFNWLKEKYGIDW